MHTAWDASERLEPKHIVYLDRRSGALVSFFSFSFLIMLLNVFLCSVVYPATAYSNLNCEHRSSRRWKASEAKVDASIYKPYHDVGLQKAVGGRVHLGPSVRVFFPIPVVRRWLCILGIGLFYYILQHFLPGKVDIPRCSSFFVFREPFFLFFFFSEGQPH
jgi:hypothetical protein